VKIGELDFTYANVLLFGLAVFLLMGVISFIKQGLKIAALFVLVLVAVVAAGGVMLLRARRSSSWTTARATCGRPNAPSPGTAWTSP
jgi:UPF0716 family protein affecting phage T7 exclusion